MKTFVILLAITSAAAAYAQSNSALTSPPLGLPRLKNRVGDGDVTPLAASMFNVDELSAGGAAGAKKGRKSSIDYVLLDPGKEWTHRLRADQRPVAVSFLLLASQSSVIEVGGARLGFTESLADANLQLMFDDASEREPQWRSMGIYLPIEKHDGRSLGAAPVLTVQIEPDLGVWHLFAGTQLLAYGLPLFRGADAKIRFKSGNDGALICGLVQADENPLFVDSNANGIDDAFEKKAHGGSLLPGNAGMEQRTATARAWKAAQKDKPAAALSYARLSPD